MTISSSCLISAWNSKVCDSAMVIKIGGSSILAKSQKNQESASPFRAAERNGGVRRPVAFIDGTLRSVPRYPSPIPRTFRIVLTIHAHVGVRKRRHIPENQIRETIVRGRLPFVSLSTTLVLSSRPIIPGMDRIFKFNVRAPKPPVLEITDSGIF